MKFTELISIALEEARAFVFQINSGRLISKNEIYDGEKLTQYCEKANTIISYGKCDHLAFMNFYLQYSYIPKLSQATTTKELLQERDDEERGRLKAILNLEDITPIEVNSPIYKYGGNILMRLATGFPVDLLELAVSCGANLNMQDSSKFGNTPLTWSIANDAKDTAITLIIIGEKTGHKVDLDMPSEFNGNTPLILCIAKGHERPNEMPNYQLTEFLLQHGADPNKPDINGLTPMHYAFLRRDGETINLLLEYGGRLDIRDQQGLFPEDILQLSYRECKDIVYKITMGDDQGSCTFPLEVIFNRDTFALQSSKYSKEAFSSQMILSAFLIKQMDCKEKNTNQRLTKSTTDSHSNSLTFKIGS